MLRNRHYASSQHWLFVSVRGIKMVPIELIVGSIGNLFAFVLCLGYAIYTFLRKGVHVKGKGWKTKDEAPKSYYITLGVMVFIALFSIISIIFRVYSYYYM